MAPDPDPRPDAERSATLRSHSTVERLYAAAIELIAEVGWDNASSRLVAQRAGVSLGVVHYHFDSIDELRRRAALASIESFFAGVTISAIDLGSSNAASDPAATIRRLFNALATGDPRRPELSVLYQTLVVAIRDDLLRVEIGTQIAEYRAILERWLTERGVDDARSVAHAIVAAVDGYLIQRALDPDLDPEPVAAALARLVSGRLRATD